VVDEVETALEGESPMLRAVQDDGLAVDAEAVFPPLIESAIGPTRD